MEAVFNHGLLAHVTREDVGCVCRGRACVWLWGVEVRGTRTGSWQSPELVGGQEDERWEWAWAKF